MSQATAFSVEVGKNGAEDLLTLTGELDMLTVPVLREKLSDLGSSGLVIDLRALTFIDSTGLAALVEQKQLMDGRRIQVVANTRNIRKVFELTGLDEVFEMVTTVSNEADVGGAEERERAS